MLTCPVANVMLPPCNRQANQVSADSAFVIRLLVLHICFCSQPKSRGVPGIGRLCAQTYIHIIHSLHQPLAHSFLSFLVPFFSIVLTLIQTVLRELVVWAGRACICCCFIWIHVGSSGSSQTTLPRKAHAQRSLFVCVWCHMGLFCLSALFQHSASKAICLPDVL